MKNVIIFLLILFLTGSCKNRMSFDPIISIENNLDTTIDSIIIRDLFDVNHNYYRIEKNTKLVDTFAFKGKTYPGGDYFPFKVFIFKDSIFYSGYSRIIDVPFANLLPHYNYNYNLSDNKLEYKMGNTLFTETPVLITPTNLKKKKFYNN